MEFQVTNRGMSVGEIHVIAVSASSILMVGDAERITLNSLYDTPPAAVEFFAEPGTAIEAYGINGKMMGETQREGQG